MALDRFLGRRGAPNAAANGMATQADHLAMSDAVRIAESDMVVATATDPGCVREANEDAVQVVRAVDGDNPRGLLAVVCDGMGGHAAGEIASRIAIETIAREWHVVGDAAQALRGAVLSANRAILATAATKRELAGMGTTVIAVIIREGMAWCAHVGDSRCYLLRDDQLFLMTEDHSAVMELVKRGQITADAARAHPDKNVISRALGARREVEVTVWPRPFRLRAGDQFLLCSDGLYDVVSDEEMRTILVACAPQDACNRLVALAREHGAPDNVTVAILAAPGATHARAHADAVRETRVGEMPVAPSAVQNAVPEDVA